jgi:hypothetical protein
MAPGQTPISLAAGRSGCQQRNHLRSTGFELHRNWTLLATEGEVRRPDGYLERLRASGYVVDEP